MILKGGKGRKEKLSDSRYIHSKNWFPRTAKACLVEGGIKRQLLEGSSIYHIGGQPGQTSEEHVFALKSIIAKYRAQGKLVIVQTLDIAKFFDKELIEDAILTSLKRGANSKACKLWLELNRGTKIRVRT